MLHKMLFLMFITNNDIKKNNNMNISAYACISASIYINQFNNGLFGNNHPRLNFFCEHLIKHNFPKDKT